MIGEKLGHFIDRPLARIARKTPFSPNVVSLAGFLVTIAASYVLISDLMTGGILVLAGGFFDMFDGVVARVNNKRTKFGAFLDSVLDRYSDSFILLAIAWNLGTHDNHTGVLLCLISLVGAFLVSYVRARAEGLGEQCQYGLMERPERLILISFGAITGLIYPVLWILVILTHFTVFQRIYYVNKRMTDKRTPL